MTCIGKLTLFFCVFFLTRCGSGDLKSKQLLYEKFDLFELKGNVLLTTTRHKSEYVQVRYIDSFPISIKFVFPTREVTLCFEDSFKVNTKPVYVYSTSNFHGGKPGRQRMSFLRHVEYKDIIFIGLPNIIACKSYEVHTVDEYEYRMHVFIQQPDGSIKNVQGRRKITEDKKLSKENLYLTWLELARQNFPNDNYPDTLHDHIPIR